MDDRHYHYDCPLCTEEAIKERCPAFRIEWTLPMEEIYVMKDIRVHFLDGTYSDINSIDLEYYESDSLFMYVEYLDKCLKDIEESK